MRLVSTNMYVHPLQVVVFVSFTVLYRVQSTVSLFQAQDVWKQVENQQW